MSENENFNEGEIIWAKTEGNPWWPSIIISKSKNMDTKDYIYSIILISSYIKANLSLQFISKYDENYKQNSRTKNKELTEAIKQANEINEIKDLEEKNKKIKEIINKENNMSNNNINNESSSETSKTKEKSGIPKKKYLKKKFGEKIENDLIYKICNFLRHLTACLVKKDNNYNFEKNKVYISKIFGFLKEYQIQDPIEFLKKTNLGKYIKYINEHAPNEEIKEEANQVYKSLENQVFNYLSKQK